MRLKDRYCFYCKRLCYGRLCRKCYLKPLEKDVVLRKVHIVKVRRGRCAIFLPKFMEGVSIRLVEVTNENRGKRLVLE